MAAAKVVTVIVRIIANITNPSPDFLRVKAITCIFVEYFVNFKSLNNLINLKILPADNKGAATPNSIKAVSTKKGKKERRSTMFIGSRKNSSVLGAVPILAKYSKVKITIQSQSIISSDKTVSSQNCGNV